jgi:hypothetical protein
MTAVFGRFAFLAPAVLLLAAALLSGCSSLKIAYSFADSVLEGRAEDYLDLSAEQEAELERQTAALISWHRQAMLPKYAVFFRHQADIAEAGGWSRPQLSAAFAKFRALVDETVAGAAPFVADVLAGHTTPEKLKHLEARMAEYVAEVRAEEAKETPQQGVDAWVARRAERISRFTGPLTDAQLAIIRRYSESGMDNAMRWLENRELRQGALVTFLRAEPTRTEIARFVHRILLHGHEIVDPGYRAVVEQRWALRERMYFDVLARLSDGQRRELVATLRGYAADMIDLAGTEKPPA